MKKVLFKLMFVVLLVSLLPAQIVHACSGFIVGKDLTADGSTLFGRTEDYPFSPDGGRHNQNYVVVPAKTYQDGEQLEDESNGFTYPHLPSEMKYTATYDAARGDGENGNYGAHGFNEVGVSMTATVSATPNDKVLGVDPLVKNGLAEAAMIDLVLPRAKTAREGIEIVAKTLDEKGSAEGNIIVLADKNELWYMEILSGHQYVAIKFPTDKYAVFANTYYLGNVDFNDKENVIASKDVEKVANEANNYKTDAAGRFHIAKSYGPDQYDDRDRSRTYAGIKWLDSQSPVTYQDDEYPLLRSPMDPNKKFTVQDVIAEQRNRFEHLPEFKADDLVEVGKDNDYNVYKYALGNENVIDAHVYQINPNLPSVFGGVVWLGLAQSRNTPYVPFYGNVEDTYEAFKPRTDKYDANSWYWSVWHIDQMVMKYPEVFGNTIQDKWKEMENRWVAEQAASDAKYATYTDEQARAASSEVTQEALARSEKIFKEIKAIEAAMEEKITQEKGEDADLVYTGYNKHNILYGYDKNDEQPAPNNPEIPTAAINIDTKAEVHRLYHPGLQVHLYTTDANEVAVLQTRGWRHEGVAWKTEKEQGDNVYRLYNAGLKVHLYTKDANEYKVLADRGWTQEGVAYHSYGSVPVYRLYNAGLKKHLYTKDANEYKVLAERGWTQEGIAWYSQP